MKFSKCYQDCAKEALEEFCQADEKYVALIVAKERNQYEDGNSTPRYVTICKKPHWTHEGVMTTSGTHDATKFKPSSEDLQEILRILNEDEEKYEMVLMDKRCLETFRNEYWEDKEVRGDWDETHSIM